MNYLWIDIGRLAHSHVISSDQREREIPQYLVVLARFLAKCGGFKQF